MASLNNNIRIVYSDRYADDDFEYRHVILPNELARTLPKTSMLTESEWRNIGVQQSPGWVHYMLHLPEPHILLFRRPKSHPIQSDFGRRSELHNDINQQEQMAVDFE